MDLVSNLREEGVRHFIVDVGSVFLDNFFDQAMKAGIVHTGNSFLTATLVSYRCCRSWRAHYFPFVNVTSTKCNQIFDTTWFKLGFHCHMAGAFSLSINDSMWLVGSWNISINQICNVTIFDTCNEHVSLFSLSHGVWLFSSLAVGIFPTNRFVVCYAKGVQNLSQLNNLWWIPYSFSKFLVLPWEWTHHQDESNFTPQPIVVSS